MRRTRRTVLASIVAGTTAVAGCSGADDPPDRDEYGVDDELPSSVDEDESDGGGDDGTDEEAVEPPSLLDDIRLGDASVVELETGDRTLALGPQHNVLEGGTTVELRFDGTATADGPATVRARLTNAEDYEREIELTDIVPFAPVTRVDYAGDEVVRPRYLAPTAAHDLVSDTPPFERGPDGFWRLRESEPTWDLPSTVTLGSGEFVDATVALVGHGDAAGFPTGRYDVSGGEFSVRLSVWQTSEPGTTVDSRFDGADLPSIPSVDEPRTTTWYHEVDPTAAVYLEPESERASMPAEIGFELVNHTHEPLSGGNWRLFKLVDDEWYYVGIRRHSFMVAFVPPGARQVWPVQFRRDGPPDSTDRSDHPEIVPYVGAGRYAFFTPLGRENETHAAAFDLEGDPLELAPTDDVRTVADGTEIRAVSDESETDDQSYLLTLERADEATEDRSDGEDGPLQRLIPEQVMREQRRGLRNTLSLLVGAADDVERVVLETSQWAARSVAPPDGESRRFRYEDRAYSLVASPTEEE